MLSDARIRETIRKGKSAQLTDKNSRGNGRLLLRFSPPLKCEWYAQQITDEGKRLVKLGDYPKTTLGDARALFASKFMPSIRARESIREAPPLKVGTVNDLFTDYVENLRKRDCRSADNVELTLLRLSDMLGSNKPANSITVKDVVRVLRPIFEKGSKSMADHMRGYIRSSYGWAIKSQNDYRSDCYNKYGITTNPAADIPTEPKKPGERWLSMAELLPFWKWLEAGGTKNLNRNTDPRNYAAIKLLIMTGQRSEEIARIQTSMLNRDLKAIEWPKTKNGKPHVLPLDDSLWDFVTGIEANEHGFLFPSEVFPDRCVTDQTMRMVCVRYIRETKAKHFNPRDLRRTWKTNAGHAGLSKDIRDRLQNHSQRDVSSVHYDRYDYLSEKRDGIVKWMEWFNAKIKSPQ